jgi:hypothetical protein
MLKVYHNITLMLVSNDDVANGHANGTRVLLKGVVLKEEATTDSVLIDGRECQAVEACDVITCWLSQKKISPNFLELRQRSSRVL